ncbi:MAG: AtpZ/AtpI family protein [Oscillospiraceae bacterium]|nr:AtpZ/AtpI family protein [Oscillospiraceae bacterium]
MKNLSLLVWLSQLGLSVALPLGGFVLLGVWLYKSHNWGAWIIVVCTIIGVICAFDGLRTSLKMMNQMAKDKNEDKPPVSFNDHE